MGLALQSRPGRGAFIDDISANDLDVTTAPGGFLRINLLNSGIQDPSAKNYNFSNVRVDCGTLVDAASISAIKPVNGLVLASISGQCKQGLKLASITGLDLRDLEVTGYTREFITQTNVQSNSVSATH
jgi:hypothetical protein